MAWALLWAVGSVQPEQERLAFELEFVAKARPLMDFYPPLPEANLYGYCLDIGRARWVPWADCLPKVPGRLLYRFLLHTIAVPSTCRRRAAAAERAPRQPRHVQQRLGFVNRRHARRRRRRRGAAAPRSKVY